VVLYSADFVQKPAQEQSPGHPKRTLNAMDSKMPGASTPAFGWKIVTHFLQPGMYCEQRNPLLLFVLFALFLLRLAQRRLLVLLFQLPPRKTQLYGLCPSS